MVIWEYFISTLINSGGKYMAENVMVYVIKSNKLL